MDSREAMECGLVILMGAGIDLTLISLPDCQTALPSLLNMQNNGISRFLISDRVGLYGVMEDRVKEIYGSPSEQSPFTRPSTCAVENHTPKQPRKNKVRVFSSQD